MESVVFRPESPPVPEFAVQAPRISILIPAYNAAQTLAQTLASIRAQTCADWEVVVIDDGSSDDTAAVAQAQGDARVRCIRQANGGISVARNRSCDEARGEYLAFIDADDLARPERLAVQMRFLDEHPDVDLCFSDFRAFDAQGPLADDFPAQYYPVLQRPDYAWSRLMPRQERWSPEGRGEASVTVHIGAPYRALAHGNFIHPPTVMMRRTLWARTGPFDTTMRSVTEWEWFVRAARQARFAYLDCVLLDYRRHPGQITGPAHVAHIAADIVTACERICAADPALHAADRAWFDRDLSQFHWTLANVEANRNAHQALRSLHLSLQRGWPGTVKCLFVLTKAFTPRWALDGAKRLARRLRPVRG